MNAFSAPSRRNGLPKRERRPSVHDLARVLMRDPLPHTQRQRVVRVEPLEERQAADPAVLVRDGRVDRGDAARSGELQPFANRGERLALAVRRLDELLAEEPRGLLAQDAGRLAALVDLDDAAFGAQVAVRVRERRRVQPHRVAVARGQRGRDVAGHGVEHLPRRLDRRRPVAARASRGRAASLPAAPIRPPPRTRSTASSSVCVPSKRTSCWASAQATKCTCESVKPGRTQRPPRSTTSGDASAVSWVPTPPAIRSPAIASDARDRQRRVERADDSVLEDHDWKNLAVLDALARPRATTSSRVTARRSARAA